LLEYRRGITDLDYMWSQDGGRLYYLIRAENDLSVLRLWQRGQKHSVLLRLPEPYWPRRIALLPNGADLLIWTDYALWVTDASGHARPFPNHLVRALPSNYSFLGVDAQGRAVVCQNLWADNRLGAIDLRTGGFKQIYP
jgi:hypothetical protein